MEIRKLALRLWIGGGSFISFLVGLAMLAHSPKPVQASSGTVQYQALEVPPLDTPEPLAPLDLSGYMQTNGAQAPQYSVQAAPTAVPQPQAPVVVPQQSTTLQQQPMTATQKKAKPVKQQGGSSSSGGAVSTGGS